MKKINLAIILISLLMACNSDDEKSVDLTNTTKLTADNSKDWYMAETSIDESDEFEECRVDGELESDNTYTFFADGTIHFDSGIKTQYIDPNDAGGCSDLKNYVGEWGFLEDETKFSWLIMHEQGKPDIDFGLDTDIFNLISLSENEMILGIEYAGEVETYTFRSK